MEINSFLESLAIHNAPFVTVVYPSKWDMENYVLELENVFYNRYKQSLVVKYLEYKEYLKSNNVEEQYIIDPLCYKILLRRHRKSLDNINEEIENARKNFE